MSEDLDVKAHWMQRVRERIGPHVCPFETWAAIRGWKRKGIGA